MKKTVILAALLAGACFASTLCAQSKNKSGETKKKFEGILTIADVEVIIVTTDGLEMPGFLKQSEFVHEFDAKAKRFLPCKDKIVMRAFTSSGEEAPVPFRDGKAEGQVKLEDIRYLIPPKSAEDKSLVLHYPDKLSGNIVVPYRTIESIEIKGTLTPDRIKQIEEGMEAVAVKRKERADAATEKLKGYLEEKREQDKRANEKNYLDKMASDLAAEKTEGKELLKRFPPEEGWGQARYDAIGKEYIAPQGQGYVDKDEDYFYKNFDKWQKAYEDVIAEQSKAGAELLDRYPPKAGWSAERMSEIQKKIDAKAALSSDEVEFAKGYEAWANARLERKLLYETLLRVYTPGEWNEERYLEIKKRQDAKQAVSENEADFVKYYTDWLRSAKWLEENEKPKEPVKEPGK